jgi:hypothetical protein
MARKRKKNQPLDNATREHQEKLNRIEPLRKDLRPYLQDGGPFRHLISHPFCIQPISDLNRCTLIHEQIDRRAAEADACFEAQDWEGYINVVEYQHQPAWFSKDAYLLPDDRYWHLLSQIYQTQKHTIHDRGLFDELFRSDRPGREHLMTPEEQAVLARLPKRLRVYRGYSGEEMYADGIAWTLDRRQAVWYANWHREDDNPTVASGTVAKADIWAYIDGGDILLPSEAVKNRRDVAAFDDTARVAWRDFLTPAFDITPMLTP